MSKKVSKDKSKSVEKDKKVQQRSSRHGSITKSGKVRAQTPKIPKTNLKKKDSPMKSNRKAFVKMINNPRKKDNSVKF
jgi:ribosomal protein S30